MRIGSLFSGIEGFGLAAYALKWELVFSVEKNEYCRDVIKKRFPSTIIYNDVQDVYRHTYEMIDVYGDGEEFLCERHGIDFSECDCIGVSQFDFEIGEIDLLCGGFPCVDITNAKNAVEKPKGLEGKESSLWYEYKRIISNIRPTYAVVENSSNLNIRGLEAIIKDFTEMRYDCFWFTVPASKIGAPHRRRRTFVVANSNDKGLEGNVCKKLANKVERGFNSYSSRPNWWSSEPGLDRLANGIPGGVEFKKQRLEAGGNAVVPAVAYVIFKAINDVNNEAMKT